MEFDLPSHRIAIRDADGFVRVQPDPYGGGTLPNYEALLPFGLMVRPKDPTNDVGTNLLLMRQGPEGRVFVGHDPRWMSALPDFGDGGVALYATTELAGAKKTPFLGFFGEGGAFPEGTFRTEVPTEAGLAVLEISATTGDLVYTHPSGTKFNVRELVELGADGGSFVLLDNGVLDAYFATLETRLGNLGQGGTAPTGYRATKVKAT